MDGDQAQKGIGWGNGWGSDLHPRNVLRPRPIEVEAIAFICGVLGRHRKTRELERSVSLHLCVATVDRAEGFAAVGIEQATVRRAPKPEQNDGDRKQTEPP